jgi:hypothetical protein
LSAAKGCIPSDLAVLGAISINEEMSVADIAELTGLVKGDLEAPLTRLRRVGYVMRTPHSDVHPHRYMYTRGQELSRARNRSLLLYGAAKEALDYEEPQLFVTPSVSDARRHVYSVAAAFAFDRVQYCVTDGYGPWLSVEEIAIATGIEECLISYAAECLEGEGLLRRKFYPSTRGDNWGQCRYAHCSVGGK